MQCDYCQQQISTLQTTVTLTGADWQQYFHADPIAPAELSCWQEMIERWAWTIAAGRRYSNGSGHYEIAKQIN